MQYDWEILLSLELGWFGYRITREPGVQPRMVNPMVL